MDAIVKHPSVALLVGEDREERSLEAALIEEMDLRTVEADSAEDALEYLEEHGSEIALLMIDISLLGANGVEFARKVSQCWPWIKLLVTSDNAVDRLRELPRAAMFMAKPWRGLDMILAVERAVHALPARQVHL